METPGPSEKPSAAFATPVMVKGMNCFGCSQPVGSAPKQLPGGQWVADCAACGITNKLLRDAENPERFFVAGALISVQRNERD